MTNSTNDQQPVDGVAGEIRYFRVGKGPPLVYLVPLAENLNGWQRRHHIYHLKPLLGSSTIYVMAGKPSLPADATMAGIAAEYAEALKELFGEPVDVMGASTGGSLALQLGVDCPELVRRLIVIAAAPRLSGLGRSATAKCAALIAQSRPAAGFRQLSPLMARSAVGQFVMGLGLMLGAALAKAGRANAGRFIATVLKAEVGLDLRRRVHELKMPVLVIAGKRDTCYDFDDARNLALQASQGRLVEFDLGHRGVIADRRTWVEVAAFTSAHHRLQPR